MLRVDGVVVAADALGHTFGVRVQWTRLRREGSEGSKGSKGSEGGGGSSAAIFKVSVTGLPSHPHRHSRIVCIGHEVKYFHCPS